MTDKRQQLIALCQLLGLAKTIKDDPAELIDAVLCENARINAENVRLNKIVNLVRRKQELIIKTRVCNEFISWAASMQELGRLDDEMFNLLVEGDNSE